MTNAGVKILQYNLLCNIQVIFLCNVRRCCEILFLFWVWVRCLSTVHEYKR